MKDWIWEASRALKQPLKRHSAGEMTASTCSVCGRGDDRLVVFEEGNFWCRKCGHRGFWDQSRASSTSQRAADGYRVNQIKRSQMVGCRDWVDYHDRVLEDHRMMQLWLDRGMQRSEISEWGLGYTDICPMTGTPSLTIPVWHNNTLVDIRHRLLDGDAGKYRSHKPGLRASLFNLDSVGRSERVLLVEGEIKAILLSRVFDSVVGVPGLNHPMVELDLNPLQSVVIMFDPGADSGAERVARDLLDAGIRSRIAHSFDKPDDLLLEFGPEIVRSIVEQAIPYG